MKFPLDWKTEKLSDLSVDGINNGTFFDPKRVGSGYRHINIDQMYVGPQIVTDNLKLLNVDDAVFKKKQAIYGDIFFTRSSLVWGGIAQCNVLLDSSQDFTFDDHLMRVRPRTDVIHPKYLNEYCRTFIARKFFLTRAKRSTMTTIGQDDIGDLIVGFPQIKEQEKITKILSTWDEAIEKLEKRISATQSMFKIMNTRFTNNLDAEEKTLSEITEKIVGGGTPSRANATYWTKGADGIPWMTVKDLKNAIVDDVEERITNEGLKNSSANLIKSGTVIVATRMAVGKTVYSTKDVAINQDLKALIVKKAIVSDKFLFYSMIANTNFLESKGTGSTVKGIILSDLSSVKLKIPSLETQDKIVRVLDSLSQEVLIQKKIFDLLKLQKQGLMQQLLTGKKRVKV